MGKPNGGRLVWNHSTHIPGLIRVLERLKGYDGIQTITPAVIGRAKSHRPQLQLKVSVPIRGGFKLIARQGKTFQEVFILTSLSKGELEKAIAIALKSNKSQ
ncbi:MAG: metal-binding protein [Symploca sp. SIO3C6]|uniref:Metal-binding protein n=1 Tax=Symploca sp. SIO1C4 TaxID=2607765 RepID=A0A6B3NC52_9CYAN|nr:metal-binding protein [Symploca sp. SIO3C6]NER30679.1 metal-binding protein [Symploca sp. SIO1C4]NET06445.1 metal-binding protein [Symploca sp. SIO2B6]NET52382.1 metal-binding protein [Merismopedia sp. SIO2A8]